MNASVHQKQRTRDVDTEERVLETVEMNSIDVHLKMLGLYLYIPIIGHKYCNMISILNKLTLQTTLDHSVTNNVFLDKK